MANRYTVSENPFGYEADVGTARLRYALTDNRPTHVSTYNARDRERQLRLPRDGEWVPFRQICFGFHKEDLQALADAMNAEADLRAVVTLAAKDYPNGV